MAEEKKKKKGKSTVRLHCNQSGPVFPLYLSFFSLFPRFNRVKHGNPLSLVDTNSFQSLLLLFPILASCFPNLLFSFSIILTVDFCLLLFCLTLLWHIGIRCIDRCLMSPKFTSRSFDFSYIPQIRVFCFSLVVFFWWTDAVSEAEGMTVCACNDAHLLLFD